MSRAMSAVRDGLFQHLTRSGRERLRLVRRAETEALVAANRLQVAGLLTSIGEYHLALAELSRRHAVTVQPQLARCAQQIVDSLTKAIQVEIEAFVVRRWEELR
jgi:phage-related minor tail protein